MGAGGTRCRATGGVGGTIGCCGGFVAVAAVLPVHLIQVIGVVVMLLLLDPLWSCLCKIFLLCLLHLPLFLLFILYSQILLNPSINCLISFCYTVNTTFFVVYFC